ncbi:MAG: carboxymuconolactone decarboxylase family protein [Anaerolineales bacterium]|nr:carboxymuconolactone decarboxylase family protein [Anaerolineales bacterium]
MNYPEKYKKILECMGTYGKASPDVMKSFQGLHHAAGSDGVLDTKTKELIALSIAVVVRCGGCIAFHVHDAIKAGATREEIIEALDVAVLMGGGPALMYVMEAIEALDQFEVTLASNGNF